MRKTSFLIILLFLLFFGTGVFAQGAEPTKAGLTPDSPFYFLEIVLEKIGTFFTFGDFKKAERHIALSAERFAEAQAMAEKGKPKLVAKTLRRYEDQLAKAWFREEKAKDKGKNTEELAKTIDEAAHKHYLVLEEALEKVPEEAKPAIRHAMIVSTKEGMEITQESGSLRALCKEKGGPSEMCDKLPLEGFKSFEELETFCVEQGGPSDLCPVLEDQCREFGVTTADECFRILSSTTTVQVNPASEVSPPSEPAVPQQPSIPETFKSFEEIETFCLETGGPPEMCSALMVQCREQGITSPDECFRVLSSAALEAFESAELKTVIQPEVGPAPPPSE